MDDSDLTTDLINNSTQHHFKSRTRFLIIRIQYACSETQQLSTSVKDGVSMVPVISFTFPPHTLLAGLQSSCFGPTGAHGADPSQVVVDRYITIWRLL